MHFLVLIEMEIMFLRDKMKLLEFKHPLPPISRTLPWCVCKGPLGTAKD